MKKDHRERLSHPPPPEDVPELSPYVACTQIKHKPQQSTSLPEPCVVRAIRFIAPQKSEHVLFFNATYCGQDQILNKCFQSNQ